MSAADIDCWVVIPATGKGARMKADRPKQYLSLGGRTILERTLDNLLSHPLIRGAILVLDALDDYWPRLSYQSDKPLICCDGGEQRYHSVFNGLSRLKNHLSEDCVVMIHDAARPFVLHEDIDKLYESIMNHQYGAILATPLADTLKLAQADQTIANTQSRENLWRALTPQAFYLNLIHAALENVIEKNLQITDDASAMEAVGYHPRLVIADQLNIKITHPQDLQLAELILAAQSN